MTTEAKRPSVDGATTVDKTHGEDNNGNTILKTLNGKPGEDQRYLLWPIKLTF